MVTQTVKVTGEVVDEGPTKTGRMDVWDPGNLPNGIQQAIIAPKLPKASGELKDVDEGGVLVQRMVTPDDAIATQGGGPEAEEGQTPGPTAQEAHDETAENYVPPDGEQTPAEEPPPEEPQA